MNSLLFYLAISLATSLFSPLVFAEAQKTTSETSTGSDPVNGISSIYSDMDMRMRLATKPNEKACSGEVCAENQRFDAQVQAQGIRLAQSAYFVYPELKKKIPNFVFGVAEKKVLGSASNATGTVILFRGLQHLDLGDEASAFIVAREMGHVIANHHKSNAKTKIFFTVLAGVLFPAVNVLSASGAAAQATTATTLLTSAASTATSYVGSEVALSRIKPTQLNEADDIALKLLEQEGYAKADVAQSLEFIVENEKATAWEKDLYQSIANVRKVVGEPKDSVIELEPLPEAYMAYELATAELMPGEKTIENTAKKATVPEAEQKAVEPHKSILITNQTIAESHQPRPTERHAELSAKKTTTSKKLILEKYTAKKKPIAVKKAKEKKIQTKPIIKGKIKNKLKAPIKKARVSKTLAPNKSSSQKLHKNKL
ncbi:MAG: M48 family metalloprotease [Methylophilaceae bacterium]